MPEMEGEGRSEVEFTDIATASESLDSSVIYHVVLDILGFVLYMHQQIPSILQDISLEFDALHTEYKDLAIRDLISKGAGSNSYGGPTKLFHLVKAPTSFSQPMHFLPKRDYRCNKKILPFRLRFKSRVQDQEMEMDSPHHGSQTASSIDLIDPASNDLIWFQSRHVIKGMACRTSPAGVINWSKNLHTCHFL